MEDRKKLRKARHDETHEKFKAVCAEHGGAATIGGYAIVDLKLYDVKEKEDDTKHI